MSFWFFAVLDNECQIFQHQQKHVTSNYLNLELSMFEHDNMQMEMTEEMHTDTIFIKNVTNKQSIYST